MRRGIYVLLVITLAIIAYVGVRNLQPAKTERSDPGANLPVDKKVVEAETRFGLRLFTELSAQDSDGNILISPASLFPLLSMVYNGAEGSTKIAMAKALGIEGMSLDQLNEANQALLANMERPGSKVEISVASSLWAKEGLQFNEDFITRNKDFYKAEIRALDFSDPKAASVMNDWVRKQTRGNINEIVDGVNGDDILYLLNAVYFKGGWTHPFDPANTRPAEFTRADGSKTGVMMMSKTLEVRHYVGSGFQAIRLPYGEERLSIYLFLPDKDSSLRKFYQNLNSKNWDAWFSSFDSSESLDIYLPRFATEYDAEEVLRRALTDMGMGAAFDMRNADFAGIWPTALNKAKRPFLRRVRHRATIQVDEKGTVASAASMANLAAAMHPEFRVDRPFFFAIRDDKTGVILFMGSISDPQ